MDRQLLKLLPIKKGHFTMESGHHGELRLILDAFFLYPHKLQPFISELGKRLNKYDINAICGPLSGGAFVGILVAAELHTEFYYTERIEASGIVHYRIPKSLHDKMKGKRVAIVDDAINAGSAVGATVKNLRACGAIPVVLAALLIQTPKATEFATKLQIPLESLTTLSNRLWLSSECELCAAGIPLDKE